MAPSKDNRVPLFQVFKTEDGKPLQKLPAQICPETGVWCIFWQDVQNAFDGVDCVDLPEWTISRRVFFMVDQYGELYVS